MYFRPYEAAGKLWTMVIPRIIFTLVLFQLTMMGIFLLGKNYVLGGLCVPLIFITFVFYVVLEKAYKENGQNLPMQLLRENVEKLPNGSDIEDEEGSSCEEEEEEKVPTPEEEAKAKEMKMIARNRWKKAALSAVNLKTEPTTEEKSIIIRPRHRKLVLDEDDYEAIPDRLTDYRQPPMQLNPGILDAGLKKYGNPLLVGVLPQLWLPVKLPVVGEDNKGRRRRSDLLHNRVSGNGGNLAQHLAEILRKVESENKSESELQKKSAETLATAPLDDGAHDALIEDSKRKARKDAANIVAGKPNTKVGVLRGLFQSGALKQNKASSSTPDLSLKDPTTTVVANDDATMDSVEKGQHNVGSDMSASTRSNSSKEIHQVYYHHPERRKSHTSQMEFPVYRRPEYKQSGLSAPAIVPDMEDHEAMASTIVRPDTQNSRHSSAPLISKKEK